jgi:hypothetical protein
MIRVAQIAVKVIRVRIIKVYYPNLRIFSVLKFNHPALFDVGFLLPGN